MGIPFFSVAFLSADKRERADLAALTERTDRRF